MELRGRVYSEPWYLRANWFAACWLLCAALLAVAVAWAWHYGASIDELALRGLAGR